jgi:hypothetical protein
MIRSDIFVGWIPNVAGRLSFSHIGASRFPKKCLTENTGNRLGRRVAIAQQRPLSDWLLPNWYHHFLYSSSAKWRFLFIATTKSDRFDQIARLEGEVFALEDEDWIRLQEINGEPSTLQDVFKIKIMRWARSSRSDSENDESLPDHLISTLREQSLFTFSAKIRRSGICWIQPNYFAGDVSFSEDYLDEYRTATSSDVRYLANQVFFFLKDISHAHRHHPPGSDTITEVGTIDKRQSWAIDTHYRIHRKIVEMRRSKDPKVLYGALGILAYITAFKKAIEAGKSESQILNLRKKLAPLSYNNSEIESSIKATLEVMKWKQTQGNIIRTAVPALILSLMAVAGYEEGSFGKIIRNYVNTFAESHFLYTLLILACISTSVPFYYKIIDLYSLPFVLRAKRILVSRTAPTHAVVWFSIATMLIATSILEFFLSYILANFGADILRQNRQAASWVIVGFGALLTLLAFYAVPVWATRRDLGSAIKRLFRWN